MAKTAVALYDSKNEANQVMNELANAGYDRSSIQILARGDNDNRTMLTNAGLPYNDAEAYMEGIRRGGNVVMITTSDSRIDTAVDIMDRYDSVNLQERTELWRNEGWAGAGTPETSGRQGLAGGRTGREHDEETIPVVEEELQVGKREVKHGGVRVHTHVEEQPVEKTVNLHEEHVNVERRPANRQASAEDLDTFQEGTMEFSETEEEAVVNKQARVVEEVVVNKDSRERQQKVHDTVRRTDVDVERVDGDTDFADYSENFRTHYNSNYANTGQSYDVYAPAYEYGYRLHNRNEMRNRNWNDIEPQARTSWEEKNPGTWDRFKNAIRHGWESIRH